MNVKNLRIAIPYIVCIIFLISGCKSEQSGSDEIIEDDVIDLNADSINAEAGKVTKIFYNVPSPIEMASLMQRAGAYYDPEILNPVENTDKYQTVSSQALNLGVYGADLSYTRIFDQIQESMNYLSAIKKLSDGLGIPRSKGSITMGKLEENIDNRDSLLTVISDTYANADLYLKENDRGSTAAKIILGGWIEALYIATNIMDSINPNKEIMERIAEQKYSLYNLIELLSLYKEQDDIAVHLMSLDELKEDYDKIEIILTKGDIDTDVDNKTTTINSDAEIKVSYEDIKQIAFTVGEIRNKIVK